MQELSRGQQEYFKDSKIRDDEGNLIPVHVGIKNTPEVFLYQATAYTDPAYIKDEEGFTPVTMYVDSKNPYFYKNAQEISDLIEENGIKDMKELAAFLEKQGYDAIVAENKAGVKEITIFHPNQIKLVGNRFPTRDDHPVDNREEYRRQNMHNMTVEEHFELARAAKKEDRESREGYGELERKGSFR